MILVPYYWFTGMFVIILCHLESSFEILSKSKLFSVPYHHHQNYNDPICYFLTLFILQLSNHLWVDLTEVRVAQSFIWITSSHHPIYITPIRYIRLIYHYIYSISIKRFILILWMIWYNYDKLQHGSPPHTIQYV